MSTDKKPTVLAFVGKGGVGKTSISAITVRILHEKYPKSRILAIDADPAIGLATALGMEPKMTVDDIRKAFVDSAEAGNQKAAIEMLGEAKYQLFDALSEKDNISFLAIGRPEAAGCYCKVNTYLKEVIRLISDNFDYIIIDGEAGIEQVNRRVMDKVTHLILVSDASKKGIEVTKTIYRVAEDLIMFKRAGIILNRVMDSDVAKSLYDGEALLLSVITDDKTMTLSDMRGDSVFLMPEDSLIYKGVKTALEKMDL